ncbi:uridine kinase family protein [Sphingobacterium spiritivorum]|uniref:Phosphoribulokinase/uridine kinase family protein n=2 Tax=Sphingobacterium spiritivorum TaxID=258 RepID=D7VMC3_SPHSI|nr:uridine kinase [Sphingobacterium spiritivorum]EFK58128.1 phosphoribulokinase/uridine kinase family protein [Sphingobacterium spiritivorum ATCC 33861]QQT34613.1 uridine kinase [Sphingobacterium spiritivorum]WQD35496.1 uridine kinase [Sphingobacterium spiritivorum]SUJ00556.1 Uridine kinase [Sphingobacterium spiritivorum]SUJ01854.1 Uridine kinase [Sphingobacterium spiritivorum]
MNNKPFVIGIAGSSGSGKTFFLNSFLQHFSKDEITLISQDDYYIPANTKTQEENRLYNFDIPTSIDRSAFYNDIKDLFDGKTVFKEEYTFNNPALTPKMLEIKPAPILIIEGLFIFYYTEVNDLLDMRIFLDAEESVALERRLRRDLIERGYDEDDVRYKWVNHVVPSYNEYLLPYREFCDKVIINNIDDPEPIRMVTDEICQEVKDKIKTI